ncbi:MAG: hypothetical protein JKY42_06215 [Flavobacteriales bacterium]|nr:hypothetical protein [Flavobacteriales bacterium]
MRFPIYNICVYILLFITVSGYGQFSGDVTGDKIIDATDYIELQHIVSGEKNHTFISDINKDGETNVADLLVLENYIYREGHTPEHGTEKQVKTQIQITPGLVDTEQNTIEIVLRNGSPIAGFQLELVGIEEIISVRGGLLEASGMRFRFHKNRIYATLDKGKEIQAGNNVLFVLSFKGRFEEICLVKPVFVNGLAELYSVQVGECANSMYTKDGCEYLKQAVLDGKSPEKYSDVNKDGYVDIADVMIVENFLYRNGPPPPGITEETKGKVKLEFEQVDNHKKSFEVKINNKKPIAGFQLTMEGVSGVTIVGGLARGNDLKLHIKDNRLTAFLANGSPIPPGSGVLLEVTYEDTLTNQVCFYDPLFISPSGNSYTMQMGECRSLIPIILGCTDMLAVNYNSRVNKEDGTCEYPPPPPKPPKPEKQKKDKPVKEKKMKEDKSIVEDVERVEEEKKKKEPKEKKEKPKRERKKEKVVEEQIDEPVSVEEK